MTYVIMKRAKSEPVTFTVFGKSRTIPLARWEKVTCLEHLFPSMNFLREKYGLKDEDIISVRFTKNLAKRGHTWTSRFRHFHNGNLLDFEKKAHDYCSRIRKQRNRKKKYLEERKKLNEQLSKERQAAEKERTMKRIMDKAREERMAAAQDIQEERW